MNHSKVYSYLGLAMKAGQLASGEFMTEAKVKEHKAKLVLVAEDASENTKKMFKNMCDYHHVPMLMFGTKDSLGKAIGKEMRASAAVLDDGFGKAITDILSL